MRRLPLDDYDNRLCFTRAQLSDLWRNRHRCTRLQITPERRGSYLESRYPDSFPNGRLHHLERSLRITAVTERSLVPMPVMA